MARSGEPRNGQRGSLGTIVIFPEGELGRNDDPLGDRMVELLQVRDAKLVQITLVPGIAAGVSQPSW